jgi:hypothetical protein
MAKKALLGPLSENMTEWNQLHLMVTNQIPFYGLFVEQSHDEEWLSELMHARMETLASMATPGDIAFMFHMPLEYTY